ncbi:MAG: hypothetical protein KR126chlam1_01144 [Chlamydiae bacterium]|nr:hypothetical protein [Chlamydiota bacterium]
MKQLITFTMAVAMICAVSSAHAGCGCKKRKKATNEVVAVVSVDNVSK